MVQAALVSMPPDHSDGVVKGGHGATAVACMFWV